MNYTIRNLRDVEDVAPRLGLDALEARFPRHDLEAQDTGLAYYVIKPGRRVGAHRHTDAEEIYFVVAGGGPINLEGEVARLSPHDAVRVAPPVRRDFEAGPNGLVLLVFGSHHRGDGEILTDDLWEGSADGLGSA
jgi:quercetin dioxygenase-like cupin family protein